MDTQDNAIYCVWIHFIPISLYPRREKTFGLSWNQTQVHLFHKQPLWPLDHGSSGSDSLWQKLASAGTQATTTWSTLQKQPSYCENMTLSLTLHLIQVVICFAKQFFINFKPHKLIFFKIYFSMHNICLAPSIACFCQLWVTWCSIVLQSDISARDRLVKHPN